MKRVVIFDLDGTLALNEHRKHLIEGSRPDWDAFYLACDKDAPNHPVVAMKRLLYNAGYLIYILSGRGEIARGKTDEWFYKNKILYHKLYMRPEGDFIPDDELKKKWLYQIGVDNVFCVFDDRQKVVEMWRREGLTCFQVAEGKF